MHPLLRNGIEAGEYWSACMSNYKTMEWKIKGESETSGIVHVKGLSYGDGKPNLGWSHHKTQDAVAAASSTVSLKTND